MANKLTVNTVQTQHVLHESSTPTKVVSGQDGGKKVSSLVKKFETPTSGTVKTNGPETSQKSAMITVPRIVKPGPGKVVPRVVTKTNGPKPGTVISPKSTGKTYNYQEYVQKFGSKTANLYEIENLGVKVPERSPVSSDDVFKHLLKNDKDGVIQRSWAAMQSNKKVDITNLKAITDTIEEIFDSGKFPFSKEQLNWINHTMAGKVIIARSTGDEDSADTPNAGGNESVLFVEPNRESVEKAMKEVVLSYFGADSLRNRIVGDGLDKVLSGLPKMPVLLMEMIAEPILDPSKVDKGDPPPVGIAMSTDKLEFTGGEDFHFVSISSAVGPGVNEGNGRVEVDETFVMQAKDGTPLLIYQQPSVKAERIRAVKDGDSITNQLQANSTPLAYKPSLSRDQVKSLVTSSDKIKSLNKGKTTEVEAVVGGDGKINFVQHRAIPDPRSKVAPTYVSTEKANGHSQPFQYTTVVPKSGDALVITDWSQVCFAETMKEAEAMFDWKGGSQKLVIVRQPDGSNSHPAVNFGSYKRDVKGTKEPSPVPCLVVPNYGELLAQKKTALAANKPLIIDGQSQTAFLWNDNTFDAKTAILDGRISHHIGLDTSTTDKDIATLVGKLKTTESGKLAALGKDLKPVLEKYKSEIKKYESLLTTNADTIYQSEGLLCQLTTLKENFEEVSRALNQVIGGNPKYTFEPGTHARLLLVKFLESSMHDVTHFNDLIEAGKTATRYQQALKGTSVDKPVFADQVNMAHDALTGPLALKWKRVLTLAEQAGLSQSEITGFKSMMTDLEKLGVTANWMSTVFENKYGEMMPTDRLGKTPAAPAAKRLINELVKDHKSTFEFLQKQQLLQKNIGEIERSIADFATPSKFEKAFGNLKNVAKPFIDGEWPKDLNDNPLKKAVQVQTLGRLIEVYDSSIKTLKSSSLPADQLVAKEVEMLETFTTLFESLFNKIELPGQNPKTKPGYLQGLAKEFDSIKKQVQKQIDEKDTEALEGHSRCGKNFNVNTCLYSSLGKVMPSNVEEMFTTVHQSLEEIRSGLMVGKSDYNIDMPKEMHALLASIPKLATQTALKLPGVLIGREITSTGVSYLYNMPVNDHGIKIKASYEKPKPGEASGKMSLEIDFWADNAQSRLEYMATLAKQFSFGGEPLDDASRRDVVWGQNQFKAKLELRSEMDVQRVSTLLNYLNTYSMAPRFGNIHHIDNLKWVVTKHNDPTSGVLPEKRQRILNDFLNVTLGTVKGAVTTEKGVVSSSTGKELTKITRTTTDYNVQLVWTKALSFVNTDDGKTYTLDFGKPRFGLPQNVFAKVPQKVLDEAKDAVQHGSRQFTFDYDGKTYTLDLKKDDLGLSAESLRELELNGKRLGELKNELSMTWDNAVFYLKGKASTDFRSNWTEFMYGTPLAFTKKSASPELDLWKAVSVKSKRGSSLKKVDKAFEKVLAKKCSLHEIESRLRELGTFASPRDKKEYGAALQAYHKELSKLDLICGGYSGKKLAEFTKLQSAAKKLSGDSDSAKSKDTVELMEKKSAQVSGKVKDLQELTAIQKKAIETQMLVYGLEPKGLSRKQARSLAFSEYL